MLLQNAQASGTSDRNRRSQQFSNMFQGGGQFYSLLQGDQQDLLQPQIFSNQGKDGMDLGRLMQIGSGMGGSSHDLLQLQQPKPE